MTRIALILAAVVAVLAVSADEPKRPAESDKLDRLRANLAAFRALPPAKQQRLRELHDSLAALPEDEREHLLRVMQRYSEWLARQSAADRAAIARAEPGPERLRVVRELLDRRWRESLPPPYRRQLEDADPVRREQLLATWRAEEEQYRQLRFAARRSVEDLSAFGPVPMMTQRKFLEDVRVYIEETLRPLLSPADEARLNALIDDGLLSPTLPQRGRILLMGQLFELSRRVGPIPLPAPAPPGRKKAVRSPDDLPDDLRATADRMIEAAPEEVRQRIREAEGKWPQFPIALGEWARKSRARLPESAFGPTKWTELPKHLRKFVAEELMPKLSPDEAGQLRAAEGKWPEYPRTIAESAKRHHLPIPGLRHAEPRDGPGKGRDGKTKGEK